MRPLRTKRLRRQQLRLLGALGLSVLALALLYRSWLLEVRRDIVHDSLGKSYFARPYTIRKWHRDLFVVFGYTRYIALELDPEDPRFTLDNDFEKLPYRPGLDGDAPSWWLPGDASAYDSYASGEEALYDRHEHVLIYHRAGTSTLYLMTAR